MRGRVMGANLRYKLRVLSGARFSKLNEVVTEINRRCGKSKANIIKDIYHCYRRFGSGYYDYITYHFYELDDKTRDTYITRMRSKKLVTFLNDSEKAKIFDNKNKFDEVFSEFIARDFLDALNCSLEEATRFYNDNEVGFAKMLDLACGKGAEVINMSDFADAKAFYDYIKEKGFGVVEEYLINHDAIREVYKPALNTMRMFTIIGDDNKPHLFFAAQKFGVNGRFIDVHGIHAPIDLETGIIHFPFHSGNTDTDLIYTKHPDTGYDLTEYKVPMFKEAAEMILKAAMVVPEMRYVGWDVAITNKGPKIVEGNNYTAYDYMQLPDQNPSRIGVIPDLLKIVPSFKDELYK